MDEFDFETLEQTLDHDRFRKLRVLTAVLEVGVFATKVNINSATEEAETLLGEIAAANARNMV